MEVCTQGFNAGRDICLRSRLRCASGNRPLCSVNPTSCRRLPAGARAAQHAHRRHVGAFEPIPVRRRRRCGESYTNTLESQRRQMRALKSVSCAPAIAACPNLTNQWRWRPPLFVRSCQPRLATALAAAARVLRSVSFCVASRRLSRSDGPGRAHGCRGGRQHPRHQRPENRCNLAGHHAGGQQLLFRCLVDCRRHCSMSHVARLTALLKRALC